MSVFKLGRITHRDYPSRLGGLRRLNVHHHRPLTNGRSPNPYTSNSTANYSCHLCHRVKHVCEGCARHDMPTVTSFWISPSRGGRDSRHDALARQTSLQVFKIISVKDPCSLTLTLGTWRARGLLAWRLKSSGHTEANLDMHPHTPLSLAYHSSLHQIATTLQQRLLLVQQEHTHTAHMDNCRFASMSVDPPSAR